jgi:hypothetical protein
MTESETIPDGAICDLCRGDFKIDRDAISVQNQRFPNAPVYWFHVSCVEKRRKPKD